MPHFQLIIRQRLSDAFTVSRPCTAALYSLQVFVLENPGCLLESRRGVHQDPVPPSLTLKQLEQDLSTTAENSLHRHSYTPGCKLTHPQICQWFNDSVEWFLVYICIAAVITFNNCTDKSFWYGMVPEECADVYRCVCMAFVCARARWLCCVGYVGLCAGICPTFWRLWACPACINVRPVRRVQYMGSYWWFIDR